MSLDASTRQDPKSLPTARVRSPEVLGRLARDERKRQDLTLDAVYSVTGLTTRFLSEFERGKPNASLGRVMQALQALGLEMLILPRGRRRAAAGATAGPDQVGFRQQGRGVNERRATVWHGDRRVGALREDENRVLRFAYDGAWLDGGRVSRLHSSASVSRR